MVHWRRWAAVVCLAAAWSACAFDANPHAPPPGPAMAAQVTLEGPIGPAAAEYFDDAVRRAGGLGWHLHPVRRAGRRVGAGHARRRGHAGADRRPYATAAGQTGR